MTGPKKSGIRKSDTPFSPLATLDEVTAKHIRDVLSSTRGKIHGKGGAADILGINASTLRNRMNKLGIKYRRKELS